MTDPRVRMVVWTSVGQSQVLEAVTPLTNVVVSVVKGAAEFEAVVSEAEVAVMLGTLEAYSRKIAACLRGSPTLRWVHLMSAGYEGIERHGFPPGCLLTRSADGVSTAVAEHAVALLWALARGLPEAQRQQTQQRWERGFAARATTLSGKILLVVGFGTIGRKVGALARAIGMHVIGVSRTGRGCEEGYELHAIADLPYVLPRADAIVVALPLNAATAGLFDQQVFDSCRPGVLFVNVGRGATVDNAALLKALAAGTVQAAALDVHDPEPLPRGDPLWSADRLLLTPHIGGAGDPHAIRRMAEGFAANLQRFLQGEPLADRVVDPSLLKVIQAPCELSN